MIFGIITKSKSRAAELKRKGYKRRAVNGKFIMYKDKKRNQWK